MQKIHVNELSEEFSMSKSTIRMDLAEPESRGLISRTHGGAIIKNELAAEDGEEMQAGV